MTVHFHTNNTNACGFKGESTTDVMKVTCKRCKATKAYKEALAAYLAEQDKKVKAEQEALTSELLMEAEICEKAVEEAIGKVSTNEVRLHFNRSKYQRTEGLFGYNTLDCGDDVAAFLRSRTFEGTVDTIVNVADSLGIKEFKKGFPATAEAIKARYDHLNWGMKRMNLGNLLRGMLSKFFAKEDINLQLIQDVEIGNIYVDENGELSFPEDEMYNEGYIKAPIAR